MQDTDSSPTPQKRAANLKSELPTFKKLILNAFLHSMLVWFVFCLFFCFGGFVLCFCFSRKKKK